MGILFPVFMEAAELPPYQKYKGPIKPGVVITKENWDTYLPELQKLLSPAKIKWYGMGVKEGWVTMPIVAAIYLPATKGQLEAARKYKGTARIGADNQLYDWVAGFPFPEPRNAQEIAWNCYPTISRSSAHDDNLFFPWMGMFKKFKYEKRFTMAAYFRKYRGRTDIPPLGDMAEFKKRGICGKESLMVNEPHEVKGFVQLRIRYWDIDKTDEMYAYIPLSEGCAGLPGLTVPIPCWEVIICQMMVRCGGRSLIPE